jgi:hypothetical protein
VRHEVLRCHSGPKEVRKDDDHPLAFRTDATFRTTKVDMVQSSDQAWLSDAFSCINEVHGG